MKTLPFLGRNGARGVIIASGAALGTLVMAAHGSWDAKRPSAAQ